jgi:hypothetical protein
MISGMRTWSLRLVGGLVLLGLAAFGAGALLPTAHVAAMRATYRQPTDRVWQAITDVDAFPAWRTGVTAVERQPTREGRQAWVEVGPQGRVPLEVVEARASSRLVLRIADPDLPFGGTWTYELVPADGGCTLTITENGEIYNPVFRLLARFVFGYHATAEQYLVSLGRKFGEAVEPRRTAH